MTTTYQDGVVIKSGQGDVYGAVVQTATDMFILNQITVGLEFDSGQFFPGQKVRIYFEGTNQDDQPKIKSVGSLS